MEFNYIQQGENRFLLKSEDAEFHVNYDSQTCSCHTNTFATCDHLVQINFLVMVEDLKSGDKDFSDIEFSSKDKLAIANILEGTMMNIEDAIIKHYKLGFYCDIPNDFAYAMECAIENHVFECRGCGHWCDIDDLDEEYEWDEYCSECADERRIEEED